MASQAEILCKYCDLLKRIKTLEQSGGAGTGNTGGGLDRYVNGGQVVGNTLVLNSTLGNINISLDSMFNDLSNIQKAAIRECFVGDLVTNLSGNTDLGYLWKL